MEDIKVSVFEDNKHLRESLGFILGNSAGFKVVGMNPDANNVLLLVEQQKPDVVLMDIQMPGISGIEAVKLIKQKFPETRIIMQTVFEDDDNIFNAICNGASGYILKNTPLEKYLDSIKEAFNGGAPLTPIIATKVLAKFKSSNVPQTHPEFDLSDREKEVLEYLVKGLSYKQIADKCCISYDTVRFHMKKIYQKLHVASMTEAVAMALKHKIV